MPLLMKILSRTLWMHWDFDKIIWFVYKNQFDIIHFYKQTEYAILIYFELSSVFKHTVIPMTISVCMHVTLMTTIY
jgi:hypothetical protein